MSDTRRETAREIARKHLGSGDPLGWFEALYAQAKEDPTVIPWADLSPNPNLMGWLDRRPGGGVGRRALVVGCGLGDDAEELARRGFETTAFDIARSAIVWARTRHPLSPVSYVVADLLRPPTGWPGRFDLVVESYTLQVLPPDLRVVAMGRIASFVAPRGTLLVIARGRETSEPGGEMPWPLTREELGLFRVSGLREVLVEDYLDDEEPPVRRFRAEYRRDGSGGETAARRDPS